MPRTYTNPVYSEYFADPFVFEHNGRYYAIGTERASDQAASAGKPTHFLMLESTDLAEWRLLGPAMYGLPAEYGNAYWAPEIAFIDGRFWLYYSVGREDKGHHLRVAVSDDPAGPYRDTDTRLTHPFHTPFAIDASPFMDDDGRWYLFYACDFLDADNRVRAGTGLVGDLMLSPTQLAGEPHVIVRAQQDWQRFLKHRVMYGGIYDWHTIEGPCVRKRNGKYWCVYSAGRWEDETYGLDYAVADHVLGPYHTGDNSHGARLLHTVPDKVLGPGHNSIVQARSGIDYLVYHAWDPAMTGRRMCIDPMEWTSDGPRTNGPTYTPQTLV